MSLGLIISHYMNKGSLDTKPAQRDYYATHRPRPRQRTRCGINRFCMPLIINLWRDAIQRHLYS